MRIYEPLEKIARILNIDHIVEKTTKDGWEVEKWHSGKMVQTLYRNEDKAGWVKGTSSIQGALFHAKTFEFAVPFTVIPTVLASARVGNGIGYGTTTWPSARDVNLHITGSQAMSSSAPVRDISIIAIGKWK